MGEMRRNQISHHNVIITISIAGFIAEQRAFVRARLIYSCVQETNVMVIYLFIQLLHNFHFDISNLTFLSDKRFIIASNTYQMIDVDALVLHVVVNWIN